MMNDSQRYPQMYAVFLHAIVPAMYSSCRALNAIGLRVIVYANGQGIVAQLQRFEILWQSILSFHQQTNFPVLYLMLAHVAHSPAWRQQGYVCLTCRHQRRRLHRQQQRRNQHVVESSASSDSWFDTLNDISDSYSDGKKARSKPKDDSVPEPQAARSTPTARSKPEPLPSPASKQQSYGLDSLMKTLNRNIGVRSRADSGASPLVSRKKIESASKKAPTRKTEKPSPKPISNTTTSEDDVEGIYANAFWNPNTTPKFSVGEVPTAKIDNVLQEMQLRSDARKAEQEGALQRKLETERALGEARSAAVDAEVMAARQLPAFMDNGRKGKSKPQSVSRPVDDVPVSDRESAQMRNGKSTEKKGSAELDEPVVEDAVPPPEINLQDFKSNLGKWSVRARLAKQRERNGLPYGGTAEQAPLAKSTKASFDSFRKADKISPKIPNPTATTKSPFGFSRVERENGSARSGAERPVEHTPENSKQAAEEDPTLAEGSNASEESAAVTVLANLSRLRNMSPSDGGAESVRNPLRHQRMLVSNSTQAQTSGQQSSGASGAGSDDDSKGKSPDRPESMSIGNAMTNSAARRKARKAEAQKEPDTGESTQPTGAATAETSSHDEGQSSSDVMSIDPSTLQIEPLDIPQPPTPNLQYGLHRVLFNPGVYQLQDPSSRVYNFDPYLQHIMPVAEFDFDSLKQYKTSSQDKALSTLAQKHGSKYIGSTSSMTSSLAHFHYLLSNWRPINLTMLSNGFVSNSMRANFTEINRAPASIFLRHRDGIYAIDADKEFDSANVLMLLGKSMEQLFTLPKSEFERYRKSNPRQVSEEQRTGPESYQYSTMRDFLMRSQLDAYDPRLPANGTFDLKTRAVVSVRMDSKDFEPMTGYEIQSLQGRWGSYEKEMYDMMRSTMLKYMLQVRMGRMNGIFIAYHNVKRIFGFQYLPIEEMDRALHGQRDPALGDQEFKASLELMNEALNKATAKFPGKSLRVILETQQAPPDGSMPPVLHIFAEPMEEEEIDKVQASQKAKIETWERDVMGKTDDAPVTAGDDVESSNSDGDSVSESVKFDSSDSDANVPFLKSVEGRSEENLKPLFYATLIVQSKVNGEYPEGDRPKNLNRNDKWEIDSILKEYETTRKTWALYEDTKARRKFAMYDEDEDGDGADSEKVSKPDSYITFLRKLSTEGSELRKKIDKMELNRDVVRVDDPLPAHGEKISGVEDYMGWLYKEKEKREEHLFG